MIALDDKTQASIWLRLALLRSILTIFSIEGETNCRITAAVTAALELA